MKQHGALFTEENRVAIREDRKTMTRRIHASFKEVNEHPDEWEFMGYLCKHKHNMTDTTSGVFRNKSDGLRISVKITWSIGDELYIKEPWAVEKRLDEFTPAMLNDFVFLHLFYKEQNKPNPLNKLRGRWRSPLFMPKWAAREWLRVTDLKVERLQEISEEDCVAEGITTVWPKNEMCGDYVYLWNRINGKKHPWARNEWVVAYTFERILFGAQTSAEPVQGRC